MEVVSVRKRRTDNKKTTKLTGDGDVDFEVSLNCQFNYFFITDIIS